ncbi:MAG: P63C domain-containing protein [Planctomycetes bacterium]|nr:P63C domain-containing protein [Planctomycetota bacterium]
MSKYKTSKKMQIKYKGELNIGNLKIPCYVTEDGQRLLSQRRMQVALGVADDDTSYQISGQRMVRFLGQKSLKPLFDKMIDTSLLEPVAVYDNKMKIVSYNAELLPELCNVILEGRREGVLKGSRQQLIAKQCEILLGGLAHIGIVALVDEATGYQDARTKDALAKILEQYLAKELQKWFKTFPDEFYKEMFRLRGLRYSPDSIKRPSYIGKLTNNIVYDRLAPGVRKELEKQNPKTTKGHRKNRHHQLLPPEFGHPKLREHLAALVALMKASSTWNGFMRLVERSLPKYGDFPLIEDAERRARQKDKAAL